MVIRKNTNFIFILLVIITTLCVGSLNVFAANKVASKLKPVVLAQVKKPTLSALGIVTWTNVANAKNYQVQLYWDSSEIGTPITVTSGKTGYDFLSKMRRVGEGRYTVKVKAKGDGKLYMDGLQSTASNTQVITEAAASEINLSNEGIATWKTPEGTSCDLKLYKDGEILDSQTGAISGYNYLEVMRSNGPGSYSITVTVNSDVGLFIDGNESIYSNKQEVATLSQIARPIWSSTTIKWKPDINATCYEVRLFKDGDEISTQTVDANTNSIDFGTIIHQNSSGIFTVTVKVKGAGLYLYGKESIASLNNVDPPELAPMEPPILSGLGVATWTDVANATNYQVQLYRDGSEQGSPQTVVSGEKGYDFLSAIRGGGPGSYTVKVTAKGDGIFHDGEQTSDSNEQVAGPVSMYNDTFENTFEPAVNVNKDRDDVLITKVAPNDLQAGVETQLTVEVEYNLVDQNEATLQIFSNCGDTPFNEMGITDCVVYKGNGKVRLTFKIVPKHWDNGHKFWIYACLNGYDNYRITNIPKYYYLEVRNSTPTDQSDNDNKSQNGPIDLSDMGEASGITIDSDGGAFYLYIDESKQPDKMAKIAYLAVVEMDSISSGLIKDIQGMATSLPTSVRSSWDYTSYYRSENIGYKYSIIFFYDKNMNFIGYYIYEQPN